MPFIFAQTPPPGTSGSETVPPNSGPGTSEPPPPAWTQFVPLIFLMVIMYVLILRPQQKRMKEHQKLLSALSKGDRVSTNGGLVGAIITVKDKTVSLRCGESKLELKKDAVTEILEKSAGGSAAESE